LQHKKPRVSAFICGKKYMEDIIILSEKIIKSAFKVSNTHGAGFLERVYENSMVIQLKKDGLKSEQQKPFVIYYDEIEVGKYYADLVVENKIILELKAIKRIENIHIAQTLNYLKASNLKLGLIINFGSPKVEIKRIANNL